MIPSLLLIIAIAGFFYAVKRARTLPPNERKKFIIKYGLYGAAAIMILLVVTGRLHWIAAGLAALLPIGQKLFYTAIRLMPFLKYWQAKQQSSQSEQQSTASTFTGKMSVKEAQEIMGLDSIDSLEQISKRHKELMQKMHPDRGGSDYLAAQINQAKETLTNHLKA